MRLRQGDGQSLYPAIKDLLSANIIDCLPSTRHYARHQNLSKSKKTWPWLEGAHGLIGTGRRYPFLFLCQFNSDLVVVGKWKPHPSWQFSSIQLLSHIRLFVTPQTAAHQASLSITNSQSLLKLVSIESVIPSNHLILCCPLLFLASIFPSIRVFSDESVLRIRWPKYWRFTFGISSSNKYLGLISFRMNWLDLLAVHGTLKSLLQHHSSKASILWCSAL